MSDQFKLSKLFYVDPRLLPNPHHPATLRKWIGQKRYYSAHHWTMLQNDIFTNGFDFEHPIIVRLVRFNKMLLEFPRFPSVTSIVKLDATHIEDGNHRLAIALELKLDYVAVRFQYLKQADD